MGTVSTRLLEEAKKHLPSVSEDDVVEVFLSNLHPLESQRRERCVTVFTRQTLYVFCGEERMLEEPMEGIASVSVINGIGCVFLELERAENGEHVIFARGDMRRHAQAAQAIKRVNHFLRYGDTDFSRFQKGEGQTCPKCGKPLREGSCGCPTKEIDPRWAVLASLKFDDDEDSK